MMDERRGEEKRGKGDIYLYPVEGIEVNCPVCPITLCNALAITLPIALARGRSPGVRG